jgi:hypothetical protein
MMKQIIVPFLVSFFIIGCTPNIKEYDAEKVEMEQVNKIKKVQADPFYSNPTPDFVRVASDDDISIEVSKLKPVVGHQNIKLDVWVIKAVNNSTIPKCVAIDWKLQDFELETGLPYEFIVLDKEVLNVGRMKQTIWSFDGAAIALPPSGYVDKLKVRDADFEKKTGKLTCDTLEENIQEPKEERN